MALNGFKRASKEALAQNLATEVGISERSKSSFESQQQLACQSGTKPPKCQTLGGAYWFFRNCAGLGGVRGRNGDGDVLPDQGKFVIRFAHGRIGKVTADILASLD